MKMKIQRVLPLLFLLTLLKSTIGIYDPDDQQSQKPVYTPGIKTSSSYVRPSQVQVHHNYSRVYHQNYDGPSRYEDQEPFRRQYPIYNAHTYGNRPQPQSERLTQQVYVLNGTRIRKDENPVRRIVIYNKEKRTPSIEAYKTCPHNATGQFVYESACNQFLNCWKGRGFVQNCAPGTLFNPKTLECDFPHKVDCVTGPRRDILEVEKSHLSVKQVGCPKEFSGLIPNYTDCSKFINCVSGIENFMDCPAGTLFDIDKNICDFAHKANCFNKQNENLKEQNVDGKLDFGSATKCESCSKKPEGLSYRSGGEIKCPQGAEGLYKHPMDCSKFLNCAHGTTYIQDCAPGTLFNPLIKICDFPYNVRCHGGGDVGVAPTGSHTDVPVYVPSSHHRDQDDYHDTTTVTYGYGSSTTRPYGYGGSTDYDSHRTFPRPDHPKGTTGSYHYNQDRVSSVTPIYHRPVHETGGYGSGNTMYHQPVGTTYDHQPSNYGYDHNRQNVYGNSQGQSSGSQFIDNNRNSWGQNQYDPYDDWSQRPAGTYDNRPREPYGSYGRPTNQYSNQPQYGQSSSSTGSTYGQTKWGSNTGTSGYDQNYNNNYKNEGRYGFYNGSSTTYGPTSWPMNNYHQGSSNYNRNNNQNWYYKNDRDYNGSRGIYEQSSWPSSGYNNNQNFHSSYYRNGSKGGYGQNTWPQNNYHQGSSSYDGSDSQNFSNNYNRNDGRYDGSSNTYGQGSWTQNNNYQGPIPYDRTDRQNFSNNYNRNDPKYGTTHGQSTWPTNNNYHQGSSSYDRINSQNFNNNYNRNDHRYGTYNSSGWSSNNYDGGASQEYDGGAVVNQRGESGYNRVYDQHPTSDRQPSYHQQNREPITPNYDHVVNVNRVQVTTPYRKPIFYGTTARSVDYEDTVRDRTVGTTATTARIQEKSWPPPFPSTDVNADYVFEYEDNVSLEAENSITDEGRPKGECGKSEFRCSMDNCVSKTLVCNGAKDCPNGDDELKCLEYVSKFSVKKEHKLAVLEKERWDNVSIAACALLCIETRKFQCRSFNYRKVDKTCFLGDSNEGLSGALIAYYPFDYYELTSERIDCSKKYVCNNKKCIDRGRLCDGKDDCGDRMDEKGCKPEDFGYRLRLTGSKDSNEGQIEVTAFGKTGFVCDDNFDIRDADVVCRELGFEMGAVEVKKNSYFAKNSTVKDPFFMMDDVTCSGDETRLMDCDFSGWGVHNCLGQEIAGVVCKTPQEKCAEDYWQCDSGNECLPLAFVCDGLLDCTDGSDEKSRYCDAATEIRLVNGSSRQQGRVEIKHHGIWGTICDDDFNEDAAKVICRQLGYKGSASVRKDAYFGAGTGPIWLDQVFCSGNETNIESCSHWDWGEHNCEHSEDVGVICSNIYEHERHSVVSVPKIPQTYPFRCGYRKDNIFNRDDDVHFRVVKGSLAKKGDYPWQAAIRVKGKANKAVSHWCGAVIISERFVVTAAHCLMGYSKGAYVVVAGDYDVDEDEGTEQEVYIEDYYVHEKFRQGHKMNNDIALIKLKGRGFQFDDDVQPICLPENGTDYETNLNCTISGFGSIQSGRSAFSHQLRAGWIPIQKKEICTMPHVYGDAITEGMICAGTLDEGIDACDGDSGGPLACLNNGVFTLYGITSWGQHCGYANKPGVYVKVAHYRKWIDDNFHKYSN